MSINVDHELIARFRAMLGKASDTGQTQTAIKQLISCSTIAADETHPLCIVGGEGHARRRMVRALAARLERLGQRSELLSFLPTGVKRPDDRRTTPKLFSDFKTAQHLMEAAECARAKGMRAIVETRISAERSSGAAMIGHLSSNCGFEPIYFHECRGGHPPDELPLRGFKRFVIGGTINTNSVAAVLRLGFEQNLAIGGFSRRAGVFLAATPSDVAEAMHRTLSHREITQDSDAPTVRPENSLDSERPVAQSARTAKPLLPDAFAALGGASR